MDRVAEVQVEVAGEDEGLRLLNPPNTTSLKFLSSRVVMYGFRILPERREYPRLGDEVLQTQNPQLPDLRTFSCCLVA